jgi:hypothetical protein
MPPTEAVLLPFFFLRQISQKIGQRALPRKLCGHLGLEPVGGHLDAQWFALAAYLPAPALGPLAASRRNDVIIVDWVSGHETHTRLRCRTAAGPSLSKRCQRCSIKLGHCVSFGCSGPMRVARPDGDWLPAKAALIILCFPERVHLPRDRRKRPCIYLLRDSTSLAFRSNIGC